MKKKGPPEGPKRRVIQVQVIVVFQDLDEKGRGRPLQQATGTAPESDFDTTIGKLVETVMRGEGQVGKKKRGP